MTVTIIVLVSFDFSPQTLAVFGGASVVAVGFATRDLLASLVAGVLDTKYEKDFETDVTLRVHRAFADHDILPPLIIQREID